MRHEGAGLFVPAVGSERGLSVCRGRNQPPPVAPGERVAAQEGGDLLTAAVPGRQRRHHEPGVLGEHRDEGVDVVSLPGSNVALDEPAQLVVAEKAKRLLLAWLGSRSSTDLCARCRALSIDTGVVSSTAAVSRAEKPRTSRRISTARCRAGRCWSAAMKASSIASRCS